MAIWALADLHLSWAKPDKDMAIFGPSWQGYMQKIEKNWLACIKKEDLVLIAGDISWASTLEEAKIDLDWIDRLPGTKVLIRGNHDYWWASNAKMQRSLPPSLHFIHKNAFHWNDVAIGGTRLWDTEEYEFSRFIEFKENPKAKKDSFSSQEETKKIFQKELERLRESLQELKQAPFRIALTHYPPIGADLEPSLTSSILEEFHIDVCLFGHLHSVQKGLLPFGKKRGVHYVLTSADYLDFMPVKIERL
jgi:uncharacterized protein